MPPRRATLLAAALAAILLAAVWLMLPVPPLSAHELARRLDGPSFQRAELRASASGPVFCIYLDPEGFLSNGPRVCILDAQGALLAQTPDVDDDPEFNDRWLTGASEPATLDHIRDALHHAGELPRLSN